MTQSHLPFPVPVPNATIPFWRTNPHPLDTHRSTASLPQKTDILIIGAGYAGISTAYHLITSSSSSPPPSIVLLEAREICSGATGRNGGHLRPSVPFPELIEKYGIAACLEIVLFEIAHMDAMKSLIEKEGIVCDFTLTGGHTVTKDPATVEFMKDVLGRYIAECPDLAEDYTVVVGEEAEKQSGVKGVIGDWQHEVAHLWPYKLFAGLLEICVKRGVNLQTNTAVLKSGGRDEEGYWGFETERGDVRAKKVVFATNGYTAGLLPEYKDVIAPRKALCTHIVVKPSAEDGKVKRMGNGWDSTYIIEPPLGGFDYLIQRPDGGVVVGGANRTYKEDGSGLGDWDDSSMIKPAEGYFEGYLERYFSTFKKGEDEETVDMAWTGIQGHTPDSLPHIGAVPGKEGQFIIAGFNGHGMPVIHLSSKGLVEMIVEGKKFEETRIPKLYEATKERLGVKFVL
ncbi:FAD dependent oxidoreductase [Mollisia scopiformis]|uniref:FAD dependent oxidoreductase n=1 Tax=Mollisia scopiformis TaxID=149040 RepID=A0A194XAC0_MOLSC|nr:FAD dependent oxidoreductase [Mollisia scopiformis]KUJ17115.1 FAD dependent oxidoreductase [Mollisia scopiformis]